MITRSECGGGRGRTDPALLAPMCGLAAGLKESATTSPDSQSVRQQERRQTPSAAAYLEMRRRCARWGTLGRSWTSGGGSGCPSWPPAGISPPSFWCSRSGAWTRTPGGRTLTVIDIKCYQSRWICSLKTAHKSHSNSCSMFSPAPLCPHPAAEAFPPCQMSHPLTG